MSDNNKPVRFGAFSVREYEVNGEKRSEWTKCGPAFPHKDGDGFNVELSVFPVNGKLVIRKIEPKDDSAD
jgi:hypothetical protein